MPYCSSAGSQRASGRCVCSRLVHATIRGRACAVGPESAPRCLVWHRAVHRDRRFATPLVLGESLGAGTVRGARRRVEPVRPGSVLAASSHRVATLSRESERPVALRVPLRSVRRRPAFGRIRDQANSLLNPDEQARPRRDSEREHGTEQRNVQPRLLPDEVSVPARA